jgi:hypothetical protein
VAGDGRNVVDADGVPAGEAEGVKEEEAVGARDGVVALLEEDVLTDDEAEAAAEAETVNEGEGDPSAAEAEGAKVALLLVGLPEIEGVEVTSGVARGDLDTAGVFVTVGKAEGGTLPTLRAPVSPLRNTTGWGPPAAQTADPDTTPRPAAERYARPCISALNEGSWLLLCF